MKEKQTDTGYFPQMPIYDATESTELTSELSLPDYQPEIRRFLHVRTEITPRGESQTPSSAEIHSDLTFKILYVGADGELYSATLGDRCTLEVPLEYTAESTGNTETELIHFCNCESTSVRVGGPRRITVHTKINHRTIALCPAYYTPTVSGGDRDEKLESCEKTANTADLRSYRSEITTLSEHIDTNGNADSLRIIDTVATPLVSDCSCSAEEISVRGEIALRVLYCNDEESDRPIAATKKIPFRINIKADNVNNTPDCNATVYLYDLHAIADENGIMVEIDVGADVSTQGRNEVKYSCDAYSLKYLSENTTKSIGIITPTACMNGNMTQNESVSLAESGIGGDAMYIVDTDAQVSVLSTEIMGNRLTVIGECKYDLVCLEDGEYTTHKIITPYRYICECRERVGEGESDCLINAYAVAPRAREDGERVYLDCEIAFSMLVKSNGKIEIIDSVSLGDEREHPADEMIICYPAPDDTPWSVAKKYGVPESTLRKNNSLPPDQNTIPTTFLVI